MKKYVASCVSILVLAVLLMPSISFAETATSSSGGQTLSELQKIIASLQAQIAALQKSGISQDEKVSRPVVSQLGGLIKIHSPENNEDLDFAKSLSIGWVYKDVAPESFLIGVKKPNGQMIYAGKEIKTKPGVYTWKNPSFMKKAGEYDLMLFKLPKDGDLSEPGGVLDVLKFTVGDRSQGVTNKKIKVDFKVNGSDNPKAVQHNDRVDVSWHSTNAVACAAVGHVVPSADGEDWMREDKTALLPTSDTRTLRATHTNLGYLDTLRIGIACYYEDLQGENSVDDYVTIRVLPKNNSIQNSIQQTTGPVSADLNLDKKVDGADLGLLVSAWGECPLTTGCPADLNSDRFVNNLDLVILTDSWSK
jgi:hypothetical protein